MSPKEEWFHAYVEVLEGRDLSDAKKMGDICLCPCCRFPTLEERGIYDICSICWWEDDGQDDADADSCFGGPNGRYSLTDARDNFRNHLHMYNSGEGNNVVENPPVVRQILLEHVRGIMNGAEKFDLCKLKRLIGELYD